jgi:hypothetical protein
MQLEDYFDFQRPDDIRVKGTRIGIETILFSFIALALPNKLLKLIHLLTWNKSMLLSFTICIIKMPLVTILLSGWNGAISN